MGYTAQDPWICNATLRNNVLMGRPYQEDLYSRCLFRPQIYFLGVFRYHLTVFQWSCCLIYFCLRGALALFVVCSEDFLNSSPACVNLSSLFVNAPCPQPVRPAGLEVHLTSLRLWQPGPA